VEGHDADVSEGLGDHINTVPAIIAEIFFQGFYDGQGTWFELLELLQRYHTLKSINVSHDRNGELCSGNVLFVLKK